MEDYKYKENNIHNNNLGIEVKKIKIQMEQILMKIQIIRKIIIKLL